MSTMASQITSLMIIYSAVYSGANQRKHQSSASLAFVWGIHQWPVNSPHKKASNAENVSIGWRHHMITHMTTHDNYIASLNSRKLSEYAICNEIRFFFQITFIWTWRWFNYRKRRTPINTKGPERPMDLIRQVNVSRFTLYLKNTAWLIVYGSTFYIFIILHILIKYISRRLDPRWYSVSDNILSLYSFNGPRSLEVHGHASDI